ncbi:hypothetical protein F5Y04DRAFT_7986 [Hypomontagnella monticulosa]|nr:hypothetical protein F5Y04DRAFT_7986 [Hypomontagnella monticulosa]
MANTEDDNVGSQAPPQPPPSPPPPPAPTLSSLFVPIPATPRRSLVLWPGLARLLCGTGKQRNGEAKAPGAKAKDDDASNKSNEEITMDAVDISTNNRVGISTPYQPEPPPSAGPDVPHYFSNVPFENDVVELDNQLSEQDLIGWEEYPPRTAPRFDIAGSAESSGSGLRDIEEVIDGHIKQSTALRQWMEETNDKRLSLQDTELDNNGEQNRNQANLLEMYKQLSIHAPDEGTRELAQAKVKEIDATISPGRKAIMGLNKALRSEIQDTYAAFTDVKKCESQASARRHAIETMHSKRPKEDPSKVRRLLGSDGASPSTTGVHQDKQLYFVGSPPQLKKLPFDQAVAARLEDTHNPLKPRPLPIPNASRPKPRRIKTPTSDAPFVFESPSNASLSPPPVLPPFSRIPDWFEHIRLPLEGTDVKDQWGDLLKRLGGLQRAVDEEKQRKQKKPTWHKIWHEPNPAWPHPHWRESGGWWICRDGPDASEAEKNCRPCLNSRTAAERKPQAADLKESLDKIMDAVNEAMAKVGKEDKATALDIIRQAYSERDSEDESRADRRQSDATTDGVPRYPQNYSLLRGCDNNTDDAGNAGDIDNADKS